MAFQTRSGRPLHLYGTYDWPDHVWNVPYSPADLEREMRWYRKHGLERVDWLDYDSYGVRAAQPGPLGANVQRAIERFGSADFLPAAARAARQAGLEFVTLYKPFDLGLGDAFLEANPRLTMRRNPAWIKPPQWPITTIRVFQCDDRPFPFTPDGLTLWTGPDREALSPVAAPFTATESVVDRPESLWSPAGRSAGTARHRVRCLEIRGLDLSGPCLAVELRGCDPAVPLRNRQYLLAEIVDGAGQELPWRLCVHQSHATADQWWRSFAWPPHDATWARLDTGMDRMLSARSEWTVLEFLIEVPLHHPIILEPAFAEARAHWLAELKRGLDAGADGVGVRVAHHVGCDDWLAYAFAAPVLDEFRRRCGRDPQPQNEDYTVIRRIRGGGFTQFLRAAHAMTAAAGKKFCLHIENRMLTPPDVDGYCQIHWDWRTWIEEKLADEIDLKYIGPDHPAAYDEIIPLAHCHGLKVNWITAALDPRSKPRGIHEAPLLAERAAAAGLDGINLYELWLYRAMTQAGYPLARGCAEAVLQGLRNRINQLNARDA